MQGYFQFFFHISFEKKGVLPKLTNYLFLLLVKALMVTHFLSYKFVERISLPEWDVSKANATWSCGLIGETLLQDTNLKSHF